MKSAGDSSHSPLKRIKPRAGKPRALKVRNKRSKTKPKTCEATIVPPSESEATLVNSSDEQTFRPPYKQTTSIDPFRHKNLPLQKATESNQIVSSHDTLVISQREREEQIMQM